MAEERLIPFNENVPAAELGQAYAYAQPKGLTAEVIRPEWVSRHKANTGYLYAKRAFDLVSSLCLLAVIWPIFAAIALAIKLDSKGPVFFMHKRVGQNGKPLRLYKFRSMVTNAQDLIGSFTPEQKKEWEENYKLTSDPRITKVGNFLRKTSLDELPQLLNILQGTLSVVGPRPVIGDELEKYGSLKGKLLSAKPGLTGYWQAYARSDCDYETRMDMELYYVDHANFIWDVRIIFATVWAVLYGKGAK